MSLRKLTYTELSDLLIENMCEVGGLTLGPADTRLLLLWLQDNEHLWAEQARLVKEAQTVLAVAVE